MPKNSFQINGKDYSLDLPDDIPLLWVLRDHLKLLGTKYGCGIGECGVCTIHINGEATKSCLVPFSSINGAKITTIEGLSNNNTHPVQKAWLEESVPQCGYCQSGQIMAAAALLQNNSNPNNNEIEVAMDKVLCRCGTYQRIRKAIIHAKKLMNEKEVSL